MDSTRSTAGALPVIVLGGAIAGTLDLCYAILSWSLRDVPATRVMQSVASGLLGKAAYEGGMQTALLGVMLHFFIALCAAAVFYAASRRLRWLVQRPVLGGTLFGIAMYAFMSFILLPLSAFPGSFKFVPLFVAINLAAHVFLFGWPIALVARLRS